MGGADAEDDTRGDPTAKECSNYLFWCSSLRAMVDQRLQDSIANAERPDTHSHNMIASSNESGFDVGDHVYLWCDVAGMSKFYQHHGIVTGVRRRRPEEEMGKEQQESDKENKSNTIDWILKVADFSLIDEEETPGSFEQLGQLCASTCTASRGSGDDNGGGFKVYDSPARKWLKVRYVNEGETQDPQGKEDRDNSKASIKSSPPHVVRARVEFLLHRPELLPPYLLHESNCECVAVWAKTGRYETSQIEYWLQGTVENGAWAVGGAQLAAMTALSAVPFLVPAVVTYGVVSAGASAVALWKAKQHWKETTDKLNDAFAQHVAAYQSVSFAIHRTENIWRLPHNLKARAGEAHNE